MFPDSLVSLNATSWTAELQADDGQPADNSAAHFTMRRQTAAEGIHGLDQILILYSQLFLPDRKYGLASLHALTKNLPRLFLHFRWAHVSSPFRRQNPRSPLSV